MDNNQFIISNPDTYLETQGKSLQERLNSVSILPEQEREIVRDSTVKTIRDKLLGLFKVGEVISTILKWDEEIDKEISNAKKSVLLEQYLNKVDQQENSINRLKMFLTAPQGNVLFNKILRILDDTPPDAELIEHLSTALKYIVNESDFHRMFEKHKFALSQIEKLTPQALTILADHRNFPSFQLSNAITFGPKVTSEWNSQFVHTYCNNKGITQEDLVSRVSHVIIQLQTQGYIEAFKLQNNKYSCEVSDIGKDLLPYITT